MSGGIYGLSGSGMDIDALVKKLMTGQQAKGDALKQKQTVVQWQKTAYNTVYDDLSNFRNTVFNYKLQANLSPNKVSSSNTAVATATANAGAAEVNHSLVVTQLADGVKLTSSGIITTGTSGTIVNQLGVATTAFDITIKNGLTSWTINIDPSKETMNDLVSKINSSGTNTQANYDSTLDRFFLATTNSGSSTEISIAGDGNAKIFIDKLKLGMASSTVAPTTTFTSAAGKDALITLDGQALTEASNTFNISGVTYNLIGVSPNPAQPTTISVTNDVDTAVTSIQSLVDSYNKILAEVNGKLNEERFIAYPPLTDAQKTDMKDTDIVLWNAKAQSGMLHNDTTLQSVVNTMRTAFSSAVSGLTGKYASASSIGITTSDYTEGGKLYLNKDTLKAALNADPNVLTNLFGATGTTTQTQGIAGRLYDGLKNTMSQLKQTAGTTTTAQYDNTSNLAQKLSSYTTQISNATDRFNTMQSTYYKQYNAMEVALQQLSAQSSWLSSMLGTSTSSG